MRKTNKARRENSSPYVRSRLHSVASLSSFSSSSSRAPSLQTLSVFHYRSDRQWTNCPVTKNAPLVVVSCPRAQKGIRTPSPALRQSARLVLFSQSCARAPTLLTNHVLYSTFQPWDGPPRVLRAVGANPLLRENHVTSERGRGD